MRINPDKCVACGNCTYVCPMGAIYIDPSIKRATINRDECVECYACFNGLSQEHLNPTFVRTLRKLFQMVRLRFDPEPDVCPTAAFEPDELAWPRVVRRAFSDPRVPHESTGVQGRGTEEVKTNDVSGRVKVGEVGFTIEFGRPGVGVWFREIQKMSWALAKAGVAFEKKNPSDFADERRRDGHAARRHPGREGAVGDRRNQGAGGAHRRDHSAGVGSGEAGGYGGRAGRGRALRREWRGERGRRRFWNGWDTNWSAPRPTSGWAGSPTRSQESQQEPAEVRTDDEHTAPFRRRRELPRRLRRLRHRQQGQERPGRVPKLRRFLEMAVPFKPVNLGDAHSRRRAAAVARDESDVALEPGHDAGFPGGDRRRRILHHGGRGVRQSRGRGGFREGA